MREIIEKLKLIEKRISEQEGSLSLFSLFLREDSEEKWDLVVSAEWLEKDKKNGYEILADEVNKILNKNELLTLSRIVLLDKRNPVLQKINQAVSCEHIDVELKDSNFFGLQIKHAFIITSKRDNGLPNHQA
jgi:hypothetical protein